MDEMKIGSKLINNVVSKLVKRMLHKKAGYDVDIQFNEVNVTITDGKAHIHLNVDADLEKAELMRILKNIGLN